jgi:hypothetical protein
MLPFWLAVTSAFPFGPPAPPPELVAVRAPEPVLVDGRLDDGAWRAAPPSDAFTQQYPDEAAPPTERTEVRVLYDDEALYVGVRCVQRSVPVVARVTRRDRVVGADRITLDVSSRADRASAFHFGVSAAGVLDDGVYFNDNEYSADWDENWEAATSVDADGWTAEIRIPFRILRFDPPDLAPEHRWGIQIQRYLHLRREWDLWSFRPRSSAAFVSTFGVLTGLTGIRPARPLELRPFALLQLRHGDAAAPQPGGDLDVSAGLDLKAHPTQGTTLDGTVNPDFGQVEADQVVLNLTNYEVFYPEKRPFFLEGVDTFAAPRAVLYTRRIGRRPPDPPVDTAAGETVVESTVPSRIWGAVKLVGAATPRTTIGALSAFTGENRAVVMGPGPGATREARLAEPAALANALRVRRRFGATTDLGVLATALSRFPPAGARGAFPDAYAAAVDGRWRSPSNDYVVSGQLVGTLLAGGLPRPHRDGISVQPGHPAFGGTFTAAKPGGRRWLGTITHSFSGRQLDYNDLGYLERKNDLLFYADLSYRTVEPWWRTLDTRTTLAVSHRQTFDGLRLEDNLRLGTGGTFSNFWAASATTYARAPRFDDLEAGDGTALERAGLIGGELWAGSDPRRAATGAAWVQVHLLENGRQIQGSASVTVRPLSRLEVELAPAALHADGEPRFVAKPDAAVPVYLFGRLRAQNLGLTLRATVGLRPSLTLQLYSQLFVATRRYTAPSAADTAGVFRARVSLDDLVPLASFPAGIADSQQQVALNVNAVLRWEYRLGSVLTLVYTRAQSPDVTVAPGTAPRLDLGPLGGNRAAVDAVMLKLSYWWG